ncbi:MAG: DUF448 domain-containing protein [Parvularculaceae bacterium]
MATGAGLTPETGLRFVLSPDGELAPDFSAKLPGRGAWLCLSRDALAAAVKKGAFARALKAGVKAPDDLAARIEAGLAKSALSALGLARRAGDVVTGFEKTRAALAAKKAAALVNAADAGEEGRRKLAGVAGDAAVIELFAEAELASALGREERTVHAALKSGPHAARFIAAARRLESFGRAKA